MKPDRWTIRHVLAWSADYLTRKGIKSARLDAELLLCHVLRCERVALYLDSERPLLEGERARYRKLLQRRGAREPAQLLLGKWGFLGHSLLVRRGVLIPRPETEQVVIRALELISVNQERPLKVLDVGTGCGNISVSLAHALPSAGLVAVDLDRKALELARENARRTATGDRLELVQADIRHLPFRQGELFDALVSNPPYIPRTEMAELEPEVRDYDPPLALDGGPDGLDLLRTIAVLAPRLVRKGGCLILEVGAGQSARVLRKVRSAGFARSGVDNDLAGIPRVVWGAELGGQVAG